MCHVVNRRKTHNWDVYVGRPTKWGNPFTVKEHGRGEALRLYNEWIMLPHQEALREQMVDELKGAVLACWCAPEPCHAHTILYIANHHE